MSTQTYRSNPAASKSPDTGSRHLLDHEQQSQRDQGQPGEPLSPLPERLADPRTEPHSQLCNQKRLRSDEHNSEPQRQVQQPDRETHRELVEADRKAKRKENQRRTTSKSDHALALALFLVHQ